MWWESLLKQFGYAGPAPALKISGLKKPQKARYCFPFEILIRYTFGRSSSGGRLFGLSRKPT
jgi:hypothetical protein